MKTTRNLIKNYDEDQRMANTHGKGGEVKGNSDKLQNIKVWSFVASF